MRKNVGVADRWIRVIIGLGLISLIFILQGAIGMNEVCFAHCFLHKTVSSERARIEIMPSPNISPGNAMIGNTLCFAKFQEYSIKIVH